MTKQVKIVFTGGGSSGHVTPNLALIEKSLKKGWLVEYIGSYAGIEKEIITREKIKYYAISSGKLRRYFSWQTFIEPFKIFKGIIQSVFILKKTDPSLVFSKGGFVAFPVVFAAWLLRIPVVVHESDLSPGLANRLSFPFSKKICTTFFETKNRINKKYSVDVTGSPVRNGFYDGSLDRGRKLCGLNDFDKNKKTLLIYGGGLGSIIINKVIRDALPQLLSIYNVVHLCGKGNKDEGKIETKGYTQFEYLYDDLFDVMALADIVISRAGSNSIYELLALKKPHILIPLSKKASRGDQVENAAYFEGKKLGLILNEETLTKETLLVALKDLAANIQAYHYRLEEYTSPLGSEAIMGVIQSTIENR